MPKITQRSTEKRPAVVNEAENDFDVPSRPGQATAVNPSPANANSEKAPVVATVKPVKSSPVNATPIIQFTASSMKVLWRKTTDSARAHRLNALARSNQDVRDLLAENESLRKQVETLSK